MAIYLVSKNKTLFNTSNYSQINFEDSLAILKELTLIQLDTETSGLDCHTKKILTLQLGNKDNQIVYDWTTLSEDQKNQLKILLEDPTKTYLGWNLS